VLVSSIVLLLLLLLPILFGVGGDCRHLAAAEGCYSVALWLLEKCGAHQTQWIGSSRTPLEVGMCCVLNLKLLEEADEDGGARSAAAEAAGAPGHSQLQPQGCIQLFMLCRQQRCKSSRGAVAAWWCFQQAPSAQPRQSNSRQVKSTLHPAPDRKICNVTSLLYFERLFVVSYGMQLSRPSHCVSCVSSSPGPPPPDPLPLGDWWRSFALLLLLLPFRMPSEETRGEVVSLLLHHGGKVTDKRHLIELGGQRPQRQPSACLGRSTRTGRWTLSRSSSRKRYSQPGQPASRLGTSRLVHISGSRPTEPC